MEMNERVFAAHFGLDKVTVTLVYVIFLAPDVQFTHLLWTLFFLKTYNTLDVCASFWSVDPKTFDKHVWDVMFVLWRKLHTVSRLHKRCALSRGLIAAFSLGRSASASALPEMDTGK